MRLYFAYTKLQIFPFSAKCRMLGKKFLCKSIKMLAVGFVSFLTLTRLVAISLSAESRGFCSFVRKEVYHEKIIVRPQCCSGFLDE